LYSYRSSGEVSSGAPPLPLALLYPFFGAFVDSLNGSEVVDEEHISNMLDFCRGMQPLFAGERECYPVVKALLEGYLPSPISSPLKIKSEKRGESTVDIRIEGQVRVIAGMRRRACSSRWLEKNLVGTWK
jgi:hypothetical protein